MPLTVIHLTLKLTILQFIIHYILVFALMIRQNIIKIKAIHLLSGLFAVVNRISRFMKESINVLKYTDSGGLWKYMGTVQVSR